MGAVDRSFPRLARIERIEPRVLLHGEEPDFHINFQPGSLNPPFAYMADSGSKFGLRTEDLSYGWASDNSGTATLRRNTGTSDRRLNTFQMLRPGNNWEIAVPNGDYTVHIVAGDPRASNATYRVNVEGFPTVSGSAPAADTWFSGTKTVTVRDGRLTLSAGAGADGTRLCYVDIAPYRTGTWLRLSSKTTRQSDGGVSAKFTIHREGSVSDTATYQYLVGGSAHNGRDYYRIGGTVKIKAGRSSASVNIRPKPTFDSPGESIMLTLLPGDGYELRNTAAVSFIAGAISSIVPTGGFAPTRVNFQPASAPAPAYYNVDSGATYGLRSNGLTYGWNINSSANARDRNSSASPDQRYDTFMHMQLSGDAKWEIAVPNGTYTVRVVAGDPSYADSVYRINVEGILAVSGTPTNSSHWIEGTKTVTVGDGRLTISNGSGASNNKIAFVEINPGSSPIPVVRLAASDGSANEAGDTASFSVTRTGSLTAALTVTYSISGSASNGTDYNALTGAVNIPAGSASASIVITPKQDTLIEGPESISLKLNTVSAYSLASKFVAGATIADDDITSAEPLSWVRGVSSPVPRVEAQAADINGKLYLLGGYQGTWWPAARSDAYDYAAKTWTRIADMPEALTHGATEAVGTDVYIAGGYVAQSDGVHQTFGTNHVWKYDTVANKWSLMPWNLPAARGAAAMVLLGHELHVMGGEPASRIEQNNHWVLDLNNTSAGWVSKAPIPNAVTHPGSAVLNGKIYQFGGQKGVDANSTYQKTNYVYDPATDKWTRLADMPTTLSHISESALVRNGKIIVFGGETKYDTATNAVYEYDPGLNQWKSLTPLPKALGSSGAGLFNGGNTVVFSTGLAHGFWADTFIGTFG
jgi:N-acetylneuraminic acid mutarotase